MTLAQNTLLVLTVILFFGLVIPEFFKRFQLPFATSLVIIGSILGPSGFNYVQVYEPLELFGFLGAAFLLLLAGFDVKHVHFDLPFKSLFNMTFFNSVTPFLAGTVVVRALGYSWKASLFTGIIFIATAPTLVISILKMLGIERTNIGHAAESIFIVEDFISLFLLTLLFQENGLASRFSIPIYLGLLVSSVIILKMFLPEITKYFLKMHKKGREDFELELRTIIVLLLVVLIIYSTLGVQPIIAAFLVGFTLAEIKRAEALKNKLHAMGYGIFVPIFFFIIGMEIDIKSLLRLDFSNIVLITVITSLMLSKFISGYLSGKLEKFSNKDSEIFGALSISKLTTTLSLTYAASSFGIIDAQLMTSIVIMSVITTIASPALTTIIMRSHKDDR